MSQILQDFSTATLLTAIEECNLLKFYAYFTRLPGAELHDDSEILWFVTGAPASPFNGVLRAELPPDEVGQKIDAAIKHFKLRNVPMRWHIGPSTRPTDLGKHLEAYGLTWIEESPGMAVDLRAVNEDLPYPSGLTIQHVEDEATLKEWVRLFCSHAPPRLAIEGATICFDIYLGLGLDSHLPLRHYLGMLNGEPVGVSSLFLAAGVASVQHVVTMPEAQRQGIGTAMTLTPLREARDLGYRFGTLSSSKMGFNLYRRLGFQEYCRFETYALRG